MHRGNRSEFITGRAKKQILDQDEASEGQEATFPLGEYYTIRCIMEDLHVPFE